MPLELKPIPKSGGPSGWEHGIGCECPVCRVRYPIEDKKELLGDELAHMVHCRPDKRPGNLIGHISDHDGTRRSEQACYIIEKYNPENAKDMAAILYGNIQPILAGNEMHSYYPMFWEDKKLVEFCHRESQTTLDGHFSKGDKYEWYMKSCVGHVDTIDIHADIWRLSPTIKHEYPTTKTWREKFKNTGIITGIESEPFEGWFDFREKSISYQEKIAKFMEML